MTIEEGWRLARQLRVKGNEVKDQAHPLHTTDTPNAGGDPFDPHSFAAPRLAVSRLPLPGRGGCAGGFGHVETPHASRMHRANNPGRRRRFPIRKCGPVRLVRPVLVPRNRYADVVFLIDPPFSDAELGVGTYGHRRQFGHGLASNAPSNG
ncbi:MULTISPECIES: hypothetical protein [unclassified Bradyrhizobium]|uniref:hypothetical protein n=1 Tax=unclassified Bradyrhizobium TaxID=2631580 RepID=UPI0028E9E26D|nr:MULTISPECIES: hypothetical protein [unclassified Bradyrhizobium]